jgi:hypothetical protein
MNPQPDPTAKFLIGIIANMTRILLTPYYYVARSDMGVQWTTITALFMPGIIYTAGFYLPAIIHSAAFGRHVQAGRVNAPIVTLYVLLLVLGFIRNTTQAWNRRRQRDWSVHSWSTGRPLLEPVLVFLCRAIYRKSGVRPWVRRLIFFILTDDFIYYVAEPVMLLLGAGALVSIDVVPGYPILMAVILIVVRSDQQLWLYLKAHEVMDAKKLEGAVKGQLEDPSLNGRGGGIPIAQIPLSLASRPPTDEKSVFDRLSPELQMLLARDREMQP